MFQNPEKVGQQLAKFVRGVLAPTQRLDYSDFCPPTGIITFSSQGGNTKMQTNQKRGNKISLSFTNEESTTVSVLTADDSKTLAQRRKSRKLRTLAKSQAQQALRNVDVTEEDFFE